MWMHISWNVKSQLAVSIPQLNALLHLHLVPIKLVVFKRPIGKSNLGGSFALNMLSALIWSAL